MADDDSAISRRTLLSGTATVGALAAGGYGLAAATAQSTDRMPPALAGKSVLITGCSSGFGRLSAMHFASLGAHVIATMRNLPRPEAESLAEEAQAGKLKVDIVEIDVLSDDSVTKGVAEAERLTGGPIDILINNAGIGITGPIELQDMAATKLIFDTNVYGYHRLARAVLPGMRAQKSGHIFAISSQLGRVIVPGAGHYSPTKFAVEAMAEQMAYELVPHNIGVTVIQPGGYPTDIWKKRNVYTKALRDRVSEERKAGYPALVARMGNEDGSGRTADPMDIPRAMAEIIEMPVSERPARRAVHPGNKPQLAINEISAKTQVDWLGNTPYGPWIKAVHKA
ncbi:SDR family oxidoreductase [Alterisphingorhabdus coralli]|uniref:SDR family oxidoreductase n=1 Tax=Alterisphingorhabdus coralli TaxID=3071408 RepID=A0AA97F8N8_9SPHN|nr:SDR family oxidoreductase [Parasphingorhabdus sp. SCSIO 66989]WOE76419.1 SDR family oxidoreductase [Parasphingorhabdus sp. SCSIO 66989]